MNLKICFKCHQSKPRNEFYAHPAMADGLLGKCKECTKRDVAERYWSPDGRHKIAIYERARSATSHRREKQLIYQRIRRKLHPEKVIARNAVSKAIRSGILQRKPCEICGTTIRIHAHHDDYSKPLNVRWLCFRCHFEHAHGYIMSTEKHQTKALPF